MIKGSIRPILTIGLVSLLFLVTGAVATKASFNDAGVAQITATTGTLSTVLTTPTSVYGPEFYSTGSVFPGTSTYVSTSTLTNTGTITAKYNADPLYSAYARENDSSFRAAEAFQIIMQINGSNVYTGSLANLNIPTQSLPAGSTHTIKMILSLPNDEKISGTNGIGIWTYLTILVTQ